MDSIATFVDGVIDALEANRPRESRLMRVCRGRG
jgi:hypothetical protein